jgi:hypothetical protein
MAAACPECNARILRIPLSNSNPEQNVTEDAGALREALVQRSSPERGAPQIETRRSETSACTYQV